MSWLIHDANFSASSGIAVPSSITKSRDTMFECGSVVQLEAKYAEDLRNGGAIPVDKNR